MSEEEGSVNIAEGSNKEGWEDSGVCQKKIAVGVSGVVASTELLNQQLIFAALQPDSLCAESTYCNAM
jgi:hypothetical protein